MRTEERRATDQPKTKFARSLEGPEGLTIQGLKEEIQDTQECMGQAFGKIQSMLQELSRDNRSGRKRTWKAEAREICYNCREKGHFARDCPSQRKQKSENDGQPALGPKGGGGWTRRRATQVSMDIIRKARIKANSSLRG